MANLYEFTAFGDTHLYTSSISSITVGANVYTAIPISRTELVLELKEQRVKITMPKTSEPALKLTGENINNQVSLKIRQIDETLLFEGNLTSCAIGIDKDRLILSFSPDYLTNNSVIPTRQYTRSCNYSLYEGYNGSSEASSPRCPRNRKDASLNPLLGETRTTWSLSGGDKTLSKTAVDSDLNIGSSDYVQGQCVIENSGAVYHSNIIVSHSTADNGGGSYTATFNMLYPVSIKDGSDTLFFYKGCDKKITTCDSKFGVVEHFGGFPEMPQAHLVQKSGFKNSAIGYKTVTDPKTGTKTKEVAGGDSELGYEYDGVVPLIFGLHWVTPQVVWNSGFETSKSVKLVEFDGLEEPQVVAYDDEGFKVGYKGAGFYSSSWTTDGFSRLYFQAFAHVLCESITALRGLRVGGESIQDSAELTALTSNLPATTTDTYFSAPLDLQTEKRHTYIYNSKEVDEAVSRAGIYWEKIADLQTIEHKFSPSFGTVHFGEQTSVDDYMDNLIEGTHWHKDRWIKEVAYVVWKHSNAWGSEFGSSDDIATVLNAGTYTNKTLAETAPYLGRDIETLPAIEYYCEHLPDLPSPNNDATKKSIDSVANPVCVIYWVLSNSLGIADASIDLSGFATARDTVYSDNLGVNIMLSKRTNTLNFISKILAVIDAALIWKSVGGVYKWTLNLARSGDSVTKTITLSNASKISFQRMGWDQVYTGIEVNYSPAGKGDEEKFTHINEAAREIVGCNRIKKVDLAGISTENTVKAVMSREFSRWTRPLSSLSFDYYDDENELYPNDLVTLSVTDTGVTYNITENYRVMSVSGMKEDTRVRRVKCIQDYVINYSTEIFTPAPAGFTGVSWTWVLADISVADLFEGYQEISYPMLTVTPLAEEPATGEIDEVRAASVYREGANKSPVSTKIGQLFKGTLNANYDVTDFIDNTSAGLTFTSSQDIPDYTGIDDDLHTLKRFAIIGDNGEEVITFNKIEKTASGSPNTYKITGIIRNVYGVTTLANPTTGQAQHLSGVSIWVTMLKGIPNLPIIPSHVTGRLPTTGYSNSPSSKAAISTTLSPNALVDVYARNNIMSSKKFALEKAFQATSNTPYPVNDLVEYQANTFSSPSHTVYLRFAPTIPRGAPLFCFPDQLVPSLGSVDSIQWEIIFKEAGTQVNMGAVVADLKAGFVFPKNNSGTVVFDASNSKIRQILSRVALTSASYDIHPLHGMLELELTFNSGQIDLETGDTLTIEIKSINKAGFKSEKRSVDLLLT